MEAIDWEGHFWKAFHALLAMETRAEKAEIELARVRRFLLSSQEAKRAEEALKQLKEVPTEIAILERYGKRYRKFINKR